MLCKAIFGRVKAPRANKKDNTLEANHVFMGVVVLKSSGVDAGFQSFGPEHPRPSRPTPTDTVLSDRKG